MSKVVSIKDEILRADITPIELQTIADQKVAEIFEKIKNQSEKIDAAKNAATNAQNYERPNLLKRIIPSCIGGSADAGKKIDKVATALSATIMAVGSLNELVQESIHFTCTSIQFAQVMHQAMSHMMVKGFKDSNGNLQKLTGNSKQFAEGILAAAQDFVTKQANAEMAQANLQVRLDEESKIISVQSQRLDELQTSLQRSMRLVLIFCILSLTISVAAIALTYFH